MRLDRGGGTPRAVALAALLALALPSGLVAQGTLSALDTDIDQIARAARPAVVTVISQRTVSQSRRRGTPERKRLHSRVGSGVALEETMVLTTASVVERAERLWVRTTNGLQSEAVVVGSDPISNLALLRVSGVRLPPLSIAVQRAPREGEWVMAIGTSHYRAQISQSVGTIAYRHREPRLSLLQLTNTVYPGYSGGAVVNARGQPVGIVQGELGPSRVSGNEAYRGAGSCFVLPIEAVRPVYQALRTEGRVRHGYLGVSTRAATVASETEKGDVIPLGALVESVVAGGPAAAAGLGKGDLIVGFEGERVEYPEQLARWVAATKPGTAVDLVWVHEELQKTARIVLSESPDTVLQWAKAADESAAQPGRIADLQKEIQRLNRELERLKETGSTR
jgi:S1-C subfamily serine protease